MGAWGYFVFENDMACDAIGRLARTQTPAQFVFETIHEHQDPKKRQEFIEDDECQDILVAVCLLLGFSDILNVHKRLESGHITENIHDELCKLIEHDQDWFTREVAQPANSDIYNLAYQLFDLVLDPALCDTALLWGLEGPEVVKVWESDVKSYKSDVAKVLSDKQPK